MSGKRPLSSSFKAALRAEVDRILKSEGVLGREEKFSGIVKSKTESPPTSAKPDKHFRGLVISKPIKIVGEKRQRFGIGLQLLD